jgi:hypothetical protein
MCDDRSSVHHGSTMNDGRAMRSGAARAIHPVCANYSARVDSLGSEESEGQKTGSNSFH